MPRNDRMANARAVAATSDTEKRRISKAAKWIAVPIRFFNNQRDRDYARPSRFGTSLVIVAEDARPETVRSLPGEKMPIGEDKIMPGRFFITEYFRFVQILAVTDRTVLFRERRQNPLAWLRSSERSMTRASFAAFARAEVNAEFFPKFANLRDYRFARPDDEQARLRLYLAELAPHRPFVTCEVHAGLPDCGFADDLPP